MSMPILDLTGRRFGRLQALYPDPSVRKNGQVAWWCKCDCGNTALVASHDLRRPNVKGRSWPTHSCGCRAKEKRHGLSKTPEWMAWKSLRTRVSNPNYRRWDRYGGRGIKVCDRWKSSFQNFLADMGPRPAKGMSIDRVNNDGNYEPSNCRWATQSEQVRNQSRWRDHDFTEPSENARASSTTPDDRSGRTASGCE